MAMRRTGRLARVQDPSVEERPLDVARPSGGRVPPSEKAPARWRSPSARRPAVKACLRRGRGRREAGIEDAARSHITDRRRVGER